MYPQYWTPSIGGIFMKYSYEFKLMCVDHVGAIMDRPAVQCFEFAETQCEFETFPCAGAH